MTRQPLVRGGTGTRRSPRSAEPASVMGGFLSLLVKLASGSERLEQARPRRRR